MKLVEGFRADQLAPNARRHGIEAEAMAAFGIKRQQLVAEVGLEKLGCSFVHRLAYWRLLTRPARDSFVSAEVDRSRVRVSSRRLGRLARGCARAAAVSSAKQPVRSGYKTKLGLTPPSQ